jgi:hypothetical protein
MIFLVFLKLSSSQTRRGKLYRPLITWSQDWAQTPEPKVELYLRRLREVVRFSTTSNRKKRLLSAEVTYKVVIVEEPKDPCPLSLQDVELWLSLVLKHVLDAVACFQQ